MSPSSPQAGTLLDRIERLEDDIRVLAARMERSRRLIFVGRWGACLGALLLAWWAFSTAGLALFVSGVALCLGGLVLAGTSRSSTDELRKKLRKTEAERNKAIDALNLR